MTCPQAAKPIWALSRYLAASIYLSVVISSVAFLDLPKTGLGIALICGLVTSIGALDGRYPMHADY